MVNVNQKKIKHTFNENFRIYKKLINTVKDEFKKLDAQEKITKDFFVSKQKFEKMAMDLREEINYYCQNWKERNVVELKSSELKRFEAFAKIKAQLNNVQNNKQTAEQDEKEYFANKESFLLDLLLEQYSMSEFDRFTRYYDCFCDAKILNDKLTIMNQNLKEALSAVEDYEHQIAISKEISNMLKGDITKDKQIKNYMQMLKDTFNKLSSENKKRYTKKIKQIETAENKLTF